MESWTITIKEAQSHSSAKGKGEAFPTRQERFVAMNIFASPENAFLPKHPVEKGLVRN